MATCSLQANSPHLASEPPDLTSESTCNAASDTACDCTSSSDLTSGGGGLYFVSASDCTSSSDAASGCTYASDSSFDSTADPVSDESSGSADVCLVAVHGATTQLQSSIESALQITESLL